MCHLDYQNTSNNPGPRKTYLLGPFCTGDNCLESNHGGSYGLTATNLTLCVVHIKLMPAGVSQSYSIYQTPVTQCRMWNSLEVVSSGLHYCYNYLLFLLKVIMIDVMGGESVSTLSINSKCCGIEQYWPCVSMISPWRHRLQPSVGWLFHPVCASVEKRSPPPHLLLRHHGFALA